MAHHNKLQSKNEKRFGWKKATAILAIGGAAALGSACAPDSTSSAHAPKGQASTSESGAPLLAQSSNNPTELKLNAMNATDVASLPVSELVTAYAPDLDSWRQISYNALVKSKGLTSDQLSSMSVPTGPKSSYSDQDILNQVSLDILDASYQDNPTFGPHALPLIISPDMNYYSSNLNIVNNNAANGGTGLLDISLYKQVGNVLPRITNRSFSDVDLTSYAQAALIQQESEPINGQAPSTEYGLYGLVKNGPDEEWQALRFYDPTDTGFITALSGLMQLHASGS